MIRHDRRGQGQGQDQFLNTNLADLFWVIPGCQCSLIMCTSKQHLTCMKLLVYYIWPGLNPNINALATRQRSGFCLYGANIQAQPYRREGSCRMEMESRPGAESASVGSCNEDFKCFWVTHRAALGEVRESLGLYLDLVLVKESTAMDCFPDQFPYMLIRSFTFPNHLKTIKKTFRTFVWLDIQIML